ncbi:aldose-1-epimerase, putative [Talaromyces stipitatus ATCC 10500]|uniref:Aldose-1-epimerase, putative n=1 Tax=Talaromyces stipitatus (strain ATCC 10500 / CBS 375.48 / QM 6759 / NRRL 1006) TaxID=441959 RepID=B8MME8_TALSN|nr:aldose-1-epimerase, putative [Talaromyces stipitatus ATCC 10500]EED13702.1 aldose-1-epimerase, putative [Talaromyces stipitatus ATCC 10500]
MSSPDSFEPFSFLRTGAVIQSWDIEGTNIVLGFPTEELYQSHNDYYFGATLGRVANRIKGARLTNLNGRTYTLQPNEGNNILHAGVNSWGHRTWEGPTKVAACKIDGLEGVTGEQSVQFQLLSEDGDEGFPGTVLATIVYTAGWQITSQGERVSVLELAYEAELIANAEETVINMTNHSYFNLTDTSTITGTQMSTCTTQHLPKDSENIPISGPAPFPGLEAEKPFTITESWPIIDHCFVVNTSPDTVPLDTRSLALQKMVETYHPDSHIHLEVWATEPAFQLYTGENTNVPAVGGCPARGARSAFCVEPERYVNAPEVEAWRRMVLLRKGEIYGSRIVYQAWKDLRA